MAGGHLAVHGLSGTRNVPVTDELTQAAIYGDLIRRSAYRPGRPRGEFLRLPRRACTGFQAALQRADGTPRPAVAPFERQSPRPLRAAPRSECLEPGRGCPRRRCRAQRRVERDGRGRDLGGRGGSGEGVRDRSRNTRLRRCSISTTVGSALLTASVGPGSIALELSLHTGEDVRAKVSIDFVAVSNPRRTTTVEHDLSTLR